MNQREKDRVHYIADRNDIDTLAESEAFADGAEYGRRGLAKRILTVLDTGNGLQEVIDICRGLKNG